MAFSKEVRDAAFSALTFSAALGTAFVLAGLDGVPPIVPALAASLVVATVEGGLGLRSPYANVEITQENVVRWVLTLIIALGLGPSCRTGPASFASRWFPGASRL